MIDMPVNFVGRSSTTQSPGRKHIEVESPDESGSKNFGEGIRKRKIVIEGPQEEEKKATKNLRNLKKGFGIFPWLKKNYIVTIQLAISFLFVIGIYFLLNWIYFTKRINNSKVSNPTYKSSGTWKISDIEFTLLEKVFDRFTNKDYIEKTCSFLRENVEGDVLEVGAGRGFALHCIDASKMQSYSAVDTNSYAFSDLQKRYEKYLQPHGVSKGEFLVKSAGDMKEIPNDSIDVVFMIRTLCSVSDSELLAVFSEIHRVLKPGGKYLFVEHVSDWKDTFRRRIQKLISPIWKIVFRGCQFKDSSLYSAVLSKFGFKVTTSNQYVSMFPNRLFSMLEPQCFGVATKVE